VNPIGERSVYDEAKRFQEAMAMAYMRTHGVDVRIVRIFNTYGERMRFDDGRVLPSLITQILKGENLTIYGDGSQTRSFCYISDLVEGIYSLLMSDYRLPMNLGNPEEISINDLAQKLLKIIGNKSGIEYQNLPSDDPKRRKPDISRAISILRWTPKIGLDEGLKNTICYFDGGNVT
jgi:dTDP-glucose 4,6-dehydratase